MREPERDARQGGRVDAPPSAGGGIDVRELTPGEVAVVDARLPLSRLDGAQTYLVAWDGGEPVGHAHIAWTRTKLGVPEVQDLFVVPRRRGEGIASELSRAAERLARERGHARISLGFSIDNDVARRLYEKLGYRDAGFPPERHLGTIVIRGREVDLDDTVIYVVKDLAR